MSSEIRAVVENPSNTDEILLVHHSDAPKGWDLPGRELPHGANPEEVLKSVFHEEFRRFVNVQGLLVELSVNTGSGIHVPGLLFAVTIDKKGIFDECTMHDAAGFFRIERANLDRRPVLEKFRWWRINECPADIALPW